MLSINKIKGKENDSILIEIDNKIRNLILKLEGFLTQLNSGGKK